ncbi:hypothetical protein Hsar01_02690 [Haloferula sargassicola]|uniref:Uncharacterized protein n=1 Tax=Haloferula sargassicola TaxID=490096 RepID=A0ABP9URY1_9BACT
MESVAPDARRKKFRPLLVIALALFGWAFLLGFGPVVWLLLLGWHLATGWIRHPWVNFPHLDWDPLTLALSIGSATLAIFLLHRFIRRHWAQRFSVTLRIAATLLTATAAAIAMTGIVHELAWLGRSKVITTNHRFSKTHTVSSARQLHLILTELAEEGVFPRTVEEIVEFYPAALPVISYRIESENDRREPFSLLQPGADLRKLPPRTPVIAAFGLEESRHLIVYADGTTEFVPAYRFEALLSP